MPGCKQNHVLFKLKDNEDKYVNTSATKNTLKCIISYYIEVGKYIKKKLRAKQKANKNMLETKLMSSVTGELYSC